MAKNDQNWTIVKNATIFWERLKKICNQHTEKLKYQKSLPLDSTMYTGLMDGHWTITAVAVKKNLITII